jgi:hypothetical protein
MRLLSSQGVLSPPLGTLQLAELRESCSRRLMAQFEEHAAKLRAAAADYEAKLKKAAQAAAQAAAQDAEPAGGEAAP